MKLATKFSNLLNLADKAEDVVEALTAFDEYVAMVLQITEWDHRMPVSEEQFVGGLVIIYSDMSYMVVIGNDEQGNVDTASALTTTGDATEDYDDPFSFIQSLASVSPEARAIMAEVKEITDRMVPTAAETVH